MSDTPAHLAQITATDHPNAGSVLGATSLFMHCTLLLMFQAGWTLMLLLGLVVGGHVAPVGIGLILLATIWMGSQFLLVVTYPEWPLNRMLCRRLRHSVSSRSRSWNHRDFKHQRVVELIPRDRWRTMSMENATDLMLMSVDARGVWLTGDCFDYALPSESILSAEVHSMRPPGCCCSTHLVILYVRTAQGPVDLPIAYRDHDLGSLTSRKRHTAAANLAQRINDIATGYYYQPPTAPDAEVLAVAESSHASPFVSPTIFAESGK